jgi:hypothetical protein
MTNALGCTKMDRAALCGEYNLRISAF